MNHNRLTTKERTNVLKQETCSQMACLGFSEVCIDIRTVNTGLNQERKARLELKKNGIINQGTTKLYVRPLTGLMHRKKNNNNQNDSLRRRNRNVNGQCPNMHRSCRQDLCLCVCLCVCLCLCAQILLWGSPTFRYEVRGQKAAHVVRHKQTHTNRHDTHTQTNKDTQTQNTNLSITGLHKVYLFPF